MPCTPPEPRPDSLADRPEWIASLVQAWAEPLAVLDLRGRVLVHNDALRGGESGRDFLDLVYPDDVPSMKRALELWLREGCPRGAAIEARLRADSPIYLWHPTELRSEDDELRALGLLGRHVWDVGHASPRLAVEPDREQSPPNETRGKARRAASGPIRTRPAAAPRPGVCWTPQPRGDILPPAAWTHRRGYP